MAKKKNIVSLSKTYEIREVGFKLEQSRIFVNAKNIKEIKDILYKTIAQEMNLKSAEEFHTVIQLMYERFQVKWKLPSLSTVRRDLAKLHIVKNDSSYYKYAQPIYSMSSEINSYCYGTFNKDSLFSLYIHVGKNLENKIAFKLFEAYYSKDYFFSVVTNIGSVQVLSDNECIIDEIHRDINEILSKS